MPRLWNETIDAHRRDVREAILDAAWKLADQQGLASVTMSAIAKEAGIGRATLYKYFSSVDEILVAWHDRHVQEHLRRLEGIREQGGKPLDRLAAVLESYALVSFERHDTELVA